MNNTEKATTHKVGGSIQSISRAFGLLEQVAKSPEGVSLSELSRATGLHSSTGFHLLKTMVTLGYLRQSEDDKRYHIGARLFFLAASARTEAQLVGIAEPIMHQLAATSECTVVLGLRAMGQVAVVSRAEGNEAFQISSRVRSASRPYHCTAMGKIMLAGMSSERLVTFLANYDLKAYTSTTITERGRLLEEIDEVRRKDLAYDDAEFHQEMRCVAAPVRDFTNQVIGALAMSAPAWRLSIDALRSRSRLLQYAADRLSSELGFRSTPSQGEEPDWRVSAELLPE